MASVNSHPPQTNIMTDRYTTIIGSVRNTPHAQRLNATVLQYHIVNKHLIKIQIAQLLQVASAADRPFELRSPP